MTVTYDDAEHQIDDIGDEKCWVAAKLVREKAKNEAAKECAYGKNCLGEGPPPCITAYPVHLRLSGREFRLNPFLSLCRAVCTSYIKMHKKAYLGLWS